MIEPPPRTNPSSWPPPLQISPRADAGDGAAGEVIGRTDLWRPEIIEDLEKLAHLQNIVIPKNLAKPRQIERGLQARVPSRTASYNRVCNCHTKGCGRSDCWPL
jgi:hypothetical protein